MTPPAERTGRRLLLDLTPFRHSRAYARLWVGTALGSIGQEMTVVTVSLQVYALTSSTFAVSLIAGIALAPMIVLGLYGGTLADRFDRRWVALIASVISWVAIIVLTVHAWVGGTSLWLLYAAATVNSVAGTVGGITRRAIVPRLLPRELLPAAGALNGINVGLMATVGPLLAAAAVGAGGFQTAFLMDAVLHTAAFLGVWALPALRPLDESRAAAVGALRAVREGLSYLRRADNIRFALTIDLFAMALAQPRVLYPALGAVTLGGGVTTVGVLSASFAAGAMFISLLSGWTGGVRRQGAAIVVVSYLYAATIAVAGIILLAAVIWPSQHATNTPAIVALAITLAVGGAADGVSAIFRGAILQAAVPDALRGRVQSIFSIIVTGGPRVGDVVTGAIASVFAIWSPLIAGGVAMLLVIWVLVRRTPSFREYDKDDPKP